MRRRLLPVLWCSLLLGAARPAPAEDQKPVRISSPDGRVELALFAEPVNGKADLRFAVAYRGRTVVQASRIGIDFADGTIVGAGSSIGDVARRTVDEAYTQFPGKRTRVVNRYNEAVFKLQTPGPNPRRWEWVARVYDDGVAFRYRFPTPPGGADPAIRGERTEFRLPAEARAVAMPLASFTTPHEDLYTRRPVGDLAENGLIGLPLLVELPGTGWAAILEADWEDYAGLYLARVPTEDIGGPPAATLAARLSPRPGDAGVAVRDSTAHESPWRAVMIGPDPGRLVESDLALNLSDPCQVPDTSWIKPGRTTFPWWNGFYEESGQIPQKLDTATAKYYIDFCARAGIPYHSLDGVHEVAWYGGPLKPWQGADIRKGGPGLDLAEVVRYGKSKGVGLRLWINWASAEAMMDRAFPVYQELGVEGVMVDLIDRDDQEISRFFRRLVSTAAKHKLTVTIHNIKEPTGLERTFPNLLTTEAVRNLEYNKWDPVGVPPEHEVTVPFTRMLAGPLDFHQGSFRTVRAEDYRSRDKAPVVIGTPCRMLASYVVFQDHLAMIADYPSAYRDQPALPLLVAIPSTWDDTRFVAGKVGEFVAIARRSGGSWWVGAMTDRAPRDLELPLNFLGDGAFRATIHQDRTNPTGPAGFRTEAVDVRAGSTLRVALMPSGGALIRIDPAR